MKRVLFHQDNAPAHMSVVAMAAVHDFGLDLVDHPPYSSGLAPSYYVLFPNMSVFQAVHEISLVLLFKVLIYLSSGGLSGRKQCS